MQSSWRVVLVSISASIAEVPELDPGQDGFPLFYYPALKLKASLEAAEGLDDVDVIVLDYYSKNTDDLAARISALEPDIVGASAYVWSLPTLVEAARTVRCARPDAWIIFGGPSARPEMLNQAPFLQYQDCIDALATGESEQVIRDIVWARKRGGRSLADIPGLSTCEGGLWKKIPQVTIDGLEAYGSVYQQNLAAGPSLAFIQTYRGCPLSCSFCQWGQMIDSARRIYSKEFLVEEFKAIKRLGPESGFLIDVALNLNARAFRNLTAAEAEVGLLRDLHLDFEVYPSSLGPEHLEFLSYIKSARIGIGVQTLDPALLKSLDRPCKVDRLGSIIERLAERAEVHLEIILGLPGDTPRSFRHTVDALRNFPCSIRVYRCLVLPDALMTRPPAGVTMDFDPVTLRMRACTGWSAEDIEAAARYVSDLSTIRDLEHTLDSSWWLIPPLARTAVPERPPIHASWGIGPSPLPASIHARSQAQSAAADAPRSLPELSECADLQPAEAVEAPPLPLPAELVAALADRIAAAGWCLEGLEPRADGCAISVSTPAGPMTLWVEEASTARRCFRRHDSVAVSYLSEDGSPPPVQLDLLTRLVDSGSREMERVMRFCKANGSHRDTPGLEPRV